MANPRSDAVPRPLHEPRQPPPVPGLLRRDARRGELPGLHVHGEVHLQMTPLHLPEVSHPVPSVVDPDPEGPTAMLTGLFGLVGGHPGRPEGGSPLLPIVEQRGPSDHPLTWRRSGRTFGLQLGLVEEEPDEGEEPDARPRVAVRLPPPFPRSPPSAPSSTPPRPRSVGRAPLHTGASLYLCRPPVCRRGGGRPEEEKHARTGAARP